MKWDDARRQVYYVRTVHRVNKSSLYVRRTGMYFVFQSVSLFWKRTRNTLPRVRTTLFIAGISKEYMDTTLICSS